MAVECISACTFTPPLFLSRLHAFRLPVRSAQLRITLRDTKFICMASVNTVVELRANLTTLG